MLNQSTLFCYKPENRLLIWSAGLPCCFLQVVVALPGVQAGVEEEVVQVRPPLVLRGQVVVVVVAAAVVAPTPVQ